MIRSCVQGLNGVRMFLEDGCVSKRETQFNVFVVVAISTIQDPSRQNLGGMNWAQFYIKTMMDFIDVQLLG